MKILRLLVSSFFIISFFGNISSVPPGFANPDNVRCYLNSPTQVLLYRDGFNGAVDRIYGRHDGADIMPVTTAYYNIKDAVVRRRALVDLHNRVATLYGQVSTALSVIDGRPQATQRDAGEYLGWFLDRIIEEGKSVFGPGFSGINLGCGFETESKRVCGVNPLHTSQRNEPFNFLNIQLRIDQQDCTLGDLFENYFATETVDDPHNLWRCNVCGFPVVSRIEKTVRSFPDILIVAIGRTYRDRSSPVARKVDALVSLPYLIMPSPGGRDYKFLPSDLPIPMYELVGVVMHMGPDVEHGHYIAFSKVNGVWHRFNDNVVTEFAESRLAINEINAADKHNGVACIVFYQKVPDVIARRAMKEGARVTREQRGIRRIREAEDVSSTALVPVREKSRALVPYGRRVREAEDVSIARRELSTALVPVKKEVTALVPYRKRPVSLERRVRSIAPAAPVERVSRGVDVGTQEELPRGVDTATQANLYGEELLGQEGESRDAILKRLKDISDRKRMLKRQLRRLGAESAELGTRLSRLSAEEKARRAARLAEQKRKEEEKRAKSFEEAKREADRL
jgi:ubiquitin C-terminal hydrolase